MFLLDKHIFNLPLYFCRSRDEGHLTSVEAISEKLSEVTNLAEKLDIALCSAQADGALTTAVTPNIKKILDGTAATTPEVKVDFKLRHRILFG